MKIIDLAHVTDAALLQSSVAEDDYPLWVPEGVYAVGQCVIRPTTHRIYEALVAGTDSTLNRTGFRGGSTPERIES